MAGERLSASPERKGLLPKPVKEAVLWTAEKSTWVTVPLTIIGVLAGSISVPGGIVLGVADVAGSRWAGNERRKLK